MDDTQELQVEPQQPPPASPEPASVTTLVPAGRPSPQPTAIITFDRDPWERQPREPLKAFHAYAHYRDMGIKRSLDKAFRAHKTNCDRQLIDSTVRAPKQWNVWNKMYAWQWRNEQFDAEQDRRLREENAEQIRTVLKRHQQTAQATLSALTVPTQAILKALADVSGLEAMVSAAKTDPKALASLIRMAANAAMSMPGIVNIERLALGLTTEQVGVDAKVEVTVDDSKRKLMMLLERVAAVR